MNPAVRGDRMNLRKLKRDVARANGTFEGARDRKIRLAQEAEAKKAAATEKIVIKEPTEATVEQVKEVAA